MFYAEFAADMKSSAAARLRPMTSISPPLLDTDMPVNPSFLVSIEGPDNSENVTALVPPVDSLSPVSVKLMARYRLPNKRRMAPANLLLLISWVLNFFMLKVVNCL
jgi:hypothetical protein